MTLDKAIKDILAFDVLQCRTIADAHDRIGQLQHHLRKTWFMQYPVPEQTSDADDYMIERRR